MKLRFYHCDICGKTIAVLTDTAVPTVCCGKPMQELIPNHTDGAIEKHVPVYAAVGNKVHVNVGSLPHPMTDEHSITWVGFRTDRGFTFMELAPGAVPETDFMLLPDEVAEEVYALCNIHGLWCADIEK